jgi:3-hydroxyisobutyrate dehydrogenase-like beta-hydroxyacid dehydrogenase
MAPVTVIGLGAMGGALAGVLLERGHELTVCSRSGVTATRGADPRPGRSCTLQESP